MNMFEAIARNIVIKEVVGRLGGEITQEMMFFLMTPGELSAWMSQVAP